MIAPALTYEGCLGDGMPNFVLWRTQRLKEQVDEKYECFEPLNSRYHQRGLEPKSFDS